MKRQNRFLVALLAAGITFATLTATIGTDHWKRGHHFGHAYWHHYDHHHDHEYDHQKSEDSDNNENSSRENNIGTEKE